MNIENEIDLLKEQTQDLADRCIACPADSDDYLKYEQLIAKNVQMLIMDAKNRMDHEEELKRIDLEKDRMKKEFDWKRPTFWIPLLVSGVTSFGMLMYQNHMLTQHRRETMLFEQDGQMFSTIAGRSNGNFFNNLLRGNKGQI